MKRKAICWILYILGTGTVLFSYTGLIPTVAGWTGWAVGMLAWALWPRPKKELPVSIRSEPRTPAGDPNEVLGHLKWSILDCETQSIISEGERDILRGELKLVVIKSDHKSMTTIGVPLSGGFELQLATVNNDASNATGFGFLVQRQNEDLFSWEWFNIDSPTHATKLQESGELAVRMSEQGKGRKIEMTEFLTEVSFRAKVRRENVGGPERYRVIVRAGSYMNWQ